MSGGNWKDMFKAATEGDLRTVEYHVSHGVDVNYVHPEILGTTLVASILAEREAVALFLLDHGADPNLLSDFEGLRPLQAARQVGLHKVADKLLDMGAEAVADETASEAPSAEAGAFSKIWKKLVG